MCDLLGPEHAVYVADDDLSVRSALDAVFTRHSYAVTSFADGDSLLGVARGRTPACILLDVHMPGRSGIEVLKELDAEQYGAPIFMVSAQRHIPLAVEAIKAGAFDFIEKPFDPNGVVARVQRGVAEWKATLGDDNQEWRAMKFAGAERLTPRERQVLLQIASGASNREAGKLLSISSRTVEVHRARIMDKIGARNAADLVRIVLSNGRGGPF
jgi:two-component system response regulator FixJ